MAMAQAMADTRAGSAAFRACFHDRTREQGPARDQPAKIFGWWGAVPWLLATILWIGAAGPLRAEIIQQPTIQGGRAHLRLVDYINRRRHDLVLAPGEHTRFRYLDIALGECRLPKNAPEKDAYAWVDIIDTRDGHTVFSGWMIASSPALSAMEHLRFDLWIVGCDAQGKSRSESGGDAEARNGADPAAPEGGLSGVEQDNATTEPSLRPPPRPFVIPVEEPPDG